MRTIIAGSRDLDIDYDEFFNIIKTIRKKTNLKFTSIFQGDSGNVDNFAKRLSWREEYYVGCKSFPADWDTHGKAAGPIRNQQMVDEADMLIVIWDGKSRGSKDVLTKARKKNLIIQEVIIENGNDRRSVIWNFQKEKE